MGTTQKTALIVEDDRNMLSLWIQVYEHAGYCTVTAENGRDALHAIDCMRELGGVDVLQTDHHLSDEVTGPEVIAHYRRSLPDAPTTFLVVTGDRRKEAEQAAYLAGAHCLLRKPVSILTLARIIEEKG